MSQDKTQAPSMTLLLSEQLIQCIPDLRRFARKLERNHARADDLVQETCERAIRKMHLYQPTGPFKGWLMRMMHNVFVDGVRKRATLMPLDEERDAEATDPSQTDGLLLKEIAEALPRLQPEQRDVLKLVAIEGQSYEAASIELGVPLGTVRSRLFRARSNLQRMIEAGTDLPAEESYPQLRRRSDVKRRI